MDWAREVGLAKPKEVEAFELDNGGLDRTSEVGELAELEGLEEGDLREWDWGGERVRFEEGDLRSERIGDGEKEKVKYKIKS